MVDDTAEPEDSAEAGHWVALLDGVPAGSGATPAEARQALPPAQRAAADVRFVEPAGALPLALAPLLQTLAPLLSNQRHPVYLTGGAVRDALLGRESKDLDFAVADRAVKLAFKVADALGVPAYVLDRQRDVGRIVLQDTVVDLARFRGADLKSDLQGRDFTINAMALPVGAVTAAGVIDPTGGRADLAARCIRLAAATALVDDPLRAIRAVRFAVNLDFTLLPETEAALRAAVGSLANVSPERIRDELLKLLGGPAPAAGLLRLHDLGLLAEVLPEAAALAHVTQSAPHRFDVFTHTARVLDWLVRLEPIWLADGDGGLPGLALRLAPFREQLRAHALRIEEGGISGWLLLRLGAITHDWGKPAVRAEEETGRVRFIGHEAAGEPLARRRLQQLKLSNRAVQRVGLIVGRHMRPLQLARVERLTRRAVYRYFRETGDSGIDIALLALADHLGTYDGTGDEPAWSRLVALVEQLFRYRFEAYETVVKPPPLLTGSDLMRALDLPPGPQIGRLLAAIEEAQAVGEVADADAALSLARRLLAAE